MIADEPLSPKCMNCRHPKGTCFPGACQWWLDKQESPHTPGPWSYDAPQDGTNGFRIVGERITKDRMAWGDIAYVTGPQTNPSSLADARLISAAPEMLHALKVIESGAPAIDLVRAAIAKAEGR